MTAARGAEPEALRKEKAGNVVELMSFLGLGEHNPDESERLIRLRQTKLLLLWTGKSQVTVVYDSDVDEFTGGRLFERVKDTPNVAVIGTTRDEDVFGGSTALLSIGCFAVITA